MCRVWEERGMARVILPKKKKKATGEEAESVKDVIVTHKPRIERVGDNLFIWRVPVYKGGRRG